MNILFFESVESARMGLKGERSPEMRVTIAEAVVAAAKAELVLAIEKLVAAELRLVEAELVVSVLSR